MVSFYRPRLAAVAGLALAASIAAPAAAQQRSLRFIPQAALAGC